MARPTIVDIARVAGVSKGAVSFALNNRPGVSEATRGRIMAVASDLGWLPNAAARSLARTSSGAIGLVVARRAQQLDAERNSLQLISGIESELGRRELALVLKLVDDHRGEIAMYRRWWAERRIDGVIVVNPHVDDDRVAPLVELGLPVAVLGIPRTMELFSGVWRDDSRAMATTLEYLANLGHVTVARVAGDPVHDHVKVRTQAFNRWAAEFGLTSAIAVAADYSASASEQATRDLLGSNCPPTAIIYENDIMALAGLFTLQEMGLGVPGDVSIVAWDDSAICQVSFPTITALRHDIDQFAATATRLLLDRIGGGLPQRVQMPDSKLQVRRSTAAPKAAAMPAKVRAAKNERKRATPQ